MIAVTRLNHAQVVLNAELIEYIEITPDTVITLTTGQKIVVLEPVEVVVDRVIQFRRSIVAGACPLGEHAHAGTLRKEAPIPA
jgi:flagellar protein FlbD